MTRVNVTQKKKIEKADLTFQLGGGRSGRRLFGCKSVGGNNPDIRSIGGGGGEGIAQDGEQKSTSWSRKDLRVEGIKGCVVQKKKKLGRQVSFDPLSTWVA